MKGVSHQHCGSEHQGLSRLASYECRVLDLKGPQNLPSVCAAQGGLPAVSCNGVSSSSPRVFPVKGTVEGLDKAIAGCS